MPRTLKINAKDGDLYLVPGDLHYDHHDQPAIQAMQDWFFEQEPLTQTRRPGRKGVVLVGDNIDAWSVSGFDKARARLWVNGPLKTELDAIRPFLRWATAHKLGCTWIQGNHEKRIEVVLDRNPEFAGLPGIEFAALTGLDQYKNLEVLQYQDRVLLGHNLVVMHGDGLRGNKTPASVSRQYPDHSVIYGHTHRLGAHYKTVYSADGTPQVRGAWNVGFLGRIPEYVQDPDWQLGFAAVRFFGPKPYYSVELHTIIRDHNGDCHVA